MQLGVGRSRGVLWLVTAVVLGLCTLAGPASAQTRRFAVDARVGTGLSVAGGDGQARVRRTPLYIEAGLHTWLAEEANIVIGASVRVEVEDRTSVGGVVRAGLRASIEPLELRPSIGLVVFFAPFTLVGAEVGLIAAMHLGDRFAILAQIAADAFPFGSDLSPSTVLAMFDGALGLEVGL